MRRQTALAAALLAIVIVSPLAPATLAAWQPSPNLAPYVPTPIDVVHRMLELADVTKDDVLYDLGCGDGRIVIEAAQRYGSRGVGIDYDPERIAEARATAKRRGLEHLVTFRQEDALTTDVSEATVVTLYLLSSSNRKLRPNLTAQLQPGSRIVSHAFGMGNWEPEETQSFEDQRGNTRTIHLWRAVGTVRP
jgi:SAM-dependent methyltransferase